MRLIKILPLKIQVYVEVRKIFEFYPLLKFTVVNL